MRPDPNNQWLRACFAKIDVTYQPEQQLAKVANSSSPHVSVDVVDIRQTQKVGEYIAIFGIKTADTVTPSDVPATLKNAFESELKNRGFVEGEGGDAVIVRRGYFRNSFANRGIVYEANASMDLEVSIVRPDGALPYRKYVTGRADDAFAIASAGNGQQMLDAAMRDRVSKSVRRPGLSCCDGKRSRPSHVIDPGKATSRLQPLLISAAFNAASGGTDAQSTLIRVAGSHVHREDCCDAVEGAVGRLDYNFADRVRIEEHVRGRDAP